MLTFLNLPKYHLLVLGSYLVLTPLAVLFLPGNFRYTVTSEQGGLVALTFFVALVGLFFLWRTVMPRSRFEFEWRSIARAILYGFLFAFPEEILFRGFVQGWLQVLMGDVYPALFLSAGVFGLAHLFNEARGWSLWQWNWKLAGQTFLAGLPLGFLFLLTQSLFFPTILHTLFLMFLQLRSRESVLVRREGIVI